MNAADERANHNCFCIHCGESLNVSSVDGGKSKRRRFFQIPPVAWFFLIIIGCDTFGILIGRLLPQIQAAREADRRVQCVENLQRIGLAMEGYHQKHGCFPPSFIPDEQGKPIHSWRVLILPFLNEQELYAKYRFDEPWDGSHNKLLQDQMPEVYRCPSDQTTDPSQTSYAMIVGPHTISDGPTAHHISDIVDGPGNTIMLVETPDESINWMEPRDLKVEKMFFHTMFAAKDVRRINREIFSNHNNVANVLFCDGTTRTLSNESIDSKEFEALTTIDGSEPVP